MSNLRISSIYLDLTAPEAVRPGKRPKKIPAHDVALEIIRDGVRLWDLECSICGGDYYADSGRAGSHFNRPVGELPHLDETLRAIAAEYAANRTNLIGAFLEPIARAIEDAIANRDGSSVYFAAAGDRIKIGWSRHVATRIGQLQVGNPDPVTLLATMPGGVSKERELHRRFAHARLAGEWFTATPDLEEFVTALCAGHPTDTTTRRTP